MQLVRTFTQDYKISLSRKIRESFIALILSITCEKYLILNYYLSICYFGDDINGAEKFAKIYFNKEIFTLKRDQLAICAAVIKHPLPKKVTKQWQNKISQRSTHAKSGLYSLAQ
jgi:penicillin-binding protein 1B